MSTSMGVTNPKFVKGGRNLKKTKYCTIPKTLMEDENEKTSRIRRKVYGLIMVKKNTTTESMQKIKWEVRELT